VVRKTPLVKSTKRALAKTAKGERNIVHDYQNQSENRAARTTSGNFKTCFKKQKPKTEWIKLSGITFGYVALPNTSVTDKVIGVGPWVSKLGIDSQPPEQAPRGGHLVAGTLLKTELNSRAFASVLEWGGEAALDGEKDDPFSSKARKARRD